MWILNQVVIVEPIFALKAWNETLFNVINDDLSEESTQYAIDVLKSISSSPLL